MGQRYEVLRDEDVEQFLHRGFVRLRGCFSPEAAARFTDALWPRLGYDPADRSTWDRARIHMPTRERVAVSEFAPKVWGAACDLVGGADRIAGPYNWGDGFIVNLAERADEPWQPPSAASPGWHKDGDFFRHFLDSPEQGLLTLVLWSDVQHQGGATFVAGDSVGPVARFLAEHPEGVLPGGFDARRLIGQCHDFVEATGEVGDVYLLHPYMLHANGPNPLRLPRVITNPPLALREPMCFDRADPNEFSLVERAVLQGLGCERYDFRPTAPRERVVPMRVQRQAQMLEDENRRLGVA